MDRSDFLGRIREAARAGRAHRVATREVPAEAGYVGAGDDPAAKLAVEIEAVGGQPTVAADLAVARNWLAGFLREKRPARVLRWEHPLLEACDVGGAVAAVNATAVSYGVLHERTPAAAREAMLAADLGIAAVDWAVAETGSLVVMSRPGQERSVTLLPPVLLSLVAGDRIVPDLFDLFTALGCLRSDTAGEAPMAGASPVASGGDTVPATSAPSTSSSAPPDLPSNLAFITGPSKTGDIELQLTTGVHGPGQWYVLIIRDPHDHADTKAAAASGR